MYYKGGARHEVTPYRLPQLYRVFVIRTFLGVAAKMSQVRNL